MNFMKEIKQRKERRFLKTLGKVGEILIQEVLLKLVSSLIKKIGGKKTLPSILFDEIDTGVSGDVAAKMALILKDLSLLLLKKTLLS